MIHTLSRNPLDEGLARRRDFCMRTHNIYKIQTTMSLVGFEPAIPGNEWPQIYALDLPATGMGYILFNYFKYISWRKF